MRGEASDPHPLEFHGVMMKREIRPEDHPPLPHPGHRLSDLRVHWHPRCLKYDVVIPPRRVYRRLDVHSVVDDQNADDLAGLRVGII